MRPSMVFSPSIACAYRWKQPQRHFLSDIRGGHLGKFGLPLLSLPDLVRECGVSLR